MSIESIPRTWNDLDVAFFTIVAALFSPDFTYGAGVLLAGFDSTDHDASDGSSTAARAVAVVASFAAATPSR